MSPRNSCTESGIDHPFGRRLVDCATAEVGPYKSWLRQRDGTIDGDVLAGYYRRTMNTNTFNRRYGAVLVALVLVMIAIGACSGSEQSTGAELDGITPTAEVAESNPAVDAPDTATATGFLTGDSDYLFDDDELRTYELVLSEEALAEIDNDPTAEQYVEGQLNFEGETLTVGIRYKGSVGAWVGCVAGSNLANPSGEKTCTKLSVKLKINWDGSDADFFGQRRLQFHSMNLDPSQMRDRLGYWLFREMGVPAPRAVHSRLLVNGEYVGLFLLVEQIDKRFIGANFDVDDGNLYKEVWPTNAGGMVQNDAAYEDALRTNEDDDPSFDIIGGFAEAIAAADEYAALDVLEQWTDVDETLRMLVVDRTIRHDDGIFHWYCLGECAPHNFYWYEDPSDDKLHLIPWDLDLAFENIEADINPITPVADDWGEITDGCKSFSYGAFGLPQRSALCDPVFAAWFQLDDRYQVLRQEFLAGPFSEPTVTEMVEKWGAQIESATKEASEAHGDAISPTTWQQAVDQLLHGVAFAREN